MFHAIILAAGRSSRMQEQPKPILPLAGKPAMKYILERLESMQIPVTVVLKHKKDEIIVALDNNLPHVLQGEEHGTGAAVKSAIQVLQDLSGQHIYVFNADDSAFLSTETIRKFADFHTSQGNTLTVMTVHKDNPTGLGRIKKVDDKVVAIVEEKDASDEEKAIQEINTGMFLFEYDWLKNALQKITPSPVTGEYYLTQLVEIAVSEGKKLGSYMLENADEWFGFNTPEQYAEAEARMKRLRGDLS